MKKLFLLLTFACCFSFAFAEKSTQEIQIRESTIPANPVRPRSLMPYTEARVNYAAQCIEVQAYAFMGELEVTLADQSGQTVYRQQMNAKDDPILSVPMPEAGRYRITVSGDEYFAEGDFRIE